MTTITREEKWSSRHVRTNIIIEEKHMAMRCELVIMKRVAKTKIQERPS